MHEPIFPEANRERNIGIYKYLNENDYKNLLRLVFLSKREKNRLGDIAFYNSLKSISPYMANVDGIPIGVSDQGEVVSIPEFDYCGNLGVYGLPSRGKTALCHSIIDGHHNRFKFNCCILNDYNNETYAWIGPCSSPLFKKKFMFVGLRPTGLPITLLIPSLVGEEIKFDVKKVPKFNFGFSYSNFISVLPRYIPMGASEKHFITKVVPRLKKNNTLEDIRNILSEEFSWKGSRGMVEKMYTIIAQLVNSGIIDNKAVNELKIKDADDEEDIGFPPVQLMKCGIIPSVITQKMLGNKFASIYFKHMLDNIIEAKRNDEGKFGRNRLLIFTDELQKIDSVEEPTPAFDSLKDVILTGRMMRTSFMFATQNAHKISEQFVDNVRFSFAFTSHGKDATMLKKRLQLNKQQGEELSRLNQLEFFAYSDVYFNVYDPIRNEKWTEQGPFKLHLIPPISDHMHPEQKVVFKSGTEHVRVFNYATQLLARNKLRLYDQAGRRIFDDELTDQKRYEHHPYIPPLYEPRLMEGIDLRKAFELKSAIGSIRVSYDYEELKKLGFIVGTWKIKPAKITKPIWIYRLIRIENIYKIPDSVSRLDKLPPKSRIEIDMDSRYLRLIGPGSDSAYWHRIKSFQ